MEKKKKEKKWKRKKKLEPPSMNLGMISSEIKILFYDGNFTEWWRRVGRRIIKKKRIYRIL